LSPEPASAKSLPKHNVHFGTRVIGFTTNAATGDEQADNDRLLMYGTALAFVCLTDDDSLTI